MKKWSIVLLTVFCLIAGMFYFPPKADAAVTYYEAKTSDVQVKKSYTSKSDTVVKLPSGYVVKVKATKTNPDSGQLWYQIDSGSYSGTSLKDLWVWSGDFKSHTHNYKSNGGVCNSSGCGASFSLSLTAYSAYVEVSNTNGTGIWSIPYSTGKSSNIRDAAYKEVLKTTHKAENADGNVWYKLSDGNWVYSGHTKKHTHDFKSNGGVCTYKGCGVSFSLSLTAYSEYVEVSNTNGTGIWSIPYSTGKSSNIRNAAYKEVLKTTHKAENADGNVWYKLSDGNWVYSGHTKKHTHDFRSNGGVCTYKGCGVSYSLSTTAFSATFVVTDSNGTKKWTLPYSTGKSKSTAIAQNTVLTVTHKATNADGHEWYKLSDGQWVYPDSRITRRYKIKYDTTGGNVSIATQYKLDGKTLTLSGIVPKKTGYIFKNWNTKSDGSGTSYNSKDSYTKNADATLYAIWTKCSSHDFLNNGGVCKKCGYEYPLTITSLDSLKYTVTNDNGAKIWSRPYSTNSTHVRTEAKGNVLTITGKTTNEPGNLWYRLSDGNWVYSNYVTRSYKINYVLNGGTNNSENPGYIYKTVTLKEPTRTGYTFGGWYSDSSFETASDTLIYIPALTTNFTVYAKWTANPYKIAFNGNGSTSGSMSTVSTKYNSSVTLPANSFIKTGYSFIGWNTKSDGSGKSYDNKATVSNLTSTKGATVTLYAQWKLNKPSITTQPVPVSVGNGYTAVFTIKASGSGLSYQWQYSDDGSTWNNSSSNGWNTASLSINSSIRIHNRQYRCIVSNSAGSVTSSSAKLTVVGIKAQPTNVTTTLGSTATFSLEATGAVSYQWYYRTSSSGNWIKVTNNGTGPSHSITTAQRHDGYQYRCCVTNNEVFVYSNTVTLKVKPKITSQPKSVTVGLGSKAEFTVKTEGAGSYQWYFSKDNGSTWTKSTASCATAATYSVTTAERHNGYKYKCVVTSPVTGTKVTSSIVTITIKPKITSQPKSKTVSSGDTVSFKVTASCATSYQWYYLSPDADSWKAVTAASGKTANYSLTATESKDGYSYRCKVMNGNSYTYSSIATLTVN